MIRARSAWVLATLWGCASNPPATVDSGTPDVPVVADVPLVADAPADVAADVRVDVPTTPPADVPTVFEDVPLEPEDTGPPADALAPLPPHATARSGRFQTHDNCATCHSAATGVLRDNAGRDVSPAALWRASMHAVAARDPYWLAVVAQEIEATPSARGTIEQVCTRCHAPAGNVALEDQMSQIHIEDITTRETPEAHLARDGVTCSACHQIGTERLGTPQSFTGGFVINSRRETYGPHESPRTAEELAAVGSTPTQSAHITQSALCGTCHTVITRALSPAGQVVGPEFPEQTCYLEWRNSAYRTEGTPGAAPLNCQGCHMPRRDVDGMDIRTVLSTQPTGLMARSTFGRHVFMGANGYMLSMLATNQTWTGSATTPTELNAGAALSDGMLRRGVILSVEGAQRAGESLNFSVRVTNAAGHRFPTGYPSRRAWIHVRVLDGDGAVRFESGRTDVNGRFVTLAGRLLEARRDVLRPHLATVTRDDQVQVYETVMVDVDGQVTHLPLRAARFAKDNRILPRGWSATHPDAALTSPVGVDGDADFRAGEDIVRFTLPAAGWTPARVEAELLFQSISPDAIVAAGRRSIPAGARFRAMTDATPPTPRVAASANAAVR